jgi:excisionase family DNA binding protein
MENNIAVVTVPLQEWNDLKAAVIGIKTSLLDMVSKSKSEFLTPKEVCELLKCSRNTFQSYVDSGALEVIKTKREKYSKVLVKRTEVYRFLEDKKALKGY